MSDHIETKKLSRLEQLEELPAQVRDDALLGWDIVALLLNRKDAEDTRRWCKSLGIPLVDTGRRQLPTLGTIRDLIKARTIIPTE